MSRPRVVAIDGAAGAGKSTLARALARRFGWTYLEVDAVHRERGRSSDTITRQEWIEAYRESSRRLDTALAAGASVVYDATNYRRVQRAQLRRIAARHGSAVMLVHVATSEAEARQRWQGNRRAPRRADVPDADFTLVAEGFQPPGPDEPHLRYDGGLSFDAWLRRTAPVAGWPDVAADTVVE